MKRPIAYLSREGLAQLPNCNGMSVWAENPSMFHDPMMPGVIAPDSLVPVFAAEVVQELREALTAYRDAIHFAQDKGALMAAIRDADDKAAKALTHVSGVQGTLNDQQEKPHD